MGTTKIKNYSLAIINYLSISTIFGDALSFIRFPLFEIRITFLILFFIFLLILPSAHKLFFNKPFLASFGCIVFLSALSVILGNNMIFLVFKQTLGILLNSVVFYLLIKINNGNIKKLFSIYLNLAIIVAFIGLVQEIAYLFKIPYLYSFGYFLPKWIYPAREYSNLLRINSILTEPSSFCFALFPAFFAAIASFFRGNYRFLRPAKSIIIIAVFMLTFSAIGYIGIILSITLLFYCLSKSRYLITIPVIAVFSLAIIYVAVPEFKIRINETVSVMSGQSELELVNQSTFALLSNALVTAKVFKTHPLFGNGLGSYQVSFERYISHVVRLSQYHVYSNAKDANSLFLRLLAETGLFGLFIFLYFVVSCYIKKNKDPLGYLWIINNGILILFIMRLIRQGHYFSEGFFFFFWIYYYSKVMTADRGKVTH